MCYWRKRADAPADTVTRELFDAVKKERDQCRAVVELLQQAQRPGLTMEQSWGFVAHAINRAAEIAGGKETKP